MVDLCHGPHLPSTGHLKVRRAAPPVPAACVCVRACVAGAGADVGGNSHTAHTTPRHATPRHATPHHTTPRDTAQAVGITNVSRAFWRADVRREPLQRVYGITFPDKALLKEYQHRERRRDARCPVCLQACFGGLFVHARAHELPLRAG
jgi:hypothetical protein